MLNQGMLAPPPVPAVGRPKLSGETYYTTPGMGSTVASSTSLGINTDFYFPTYVATPIVVDQLAFEVSTAVAGNTRIGLYAADRDYQPVGGPLADSGDISTAGLGVKTYTPASPIALPAGRYLTVLNSTVAPGVRIITGPTFGISSTIGASPAFESGSVARTYAAFPTPGSLWTAGNIGNSGRHPIFLRISQP